MFVSCDRDHLSNTPWEDHYILTWVGICKTDLSTYTGDNPNKDILTCVTSVSCVAIVAMTNVAGHVVFTGTIYTRGWCTMIYNCEIMYKIRGLVWVSCGLYKQKLIDK